jgi:hypothetical protein
MTETKLKIEGKCHLRRPARNAGPARKEFLTQRWGKVRLVSLIS